MGDTRELVVIEERSIAEVKAQVGKIQSLMKDLMHEGEHYGPSFPGDKKKNLLKPGADKICFVFRLAPEYEVTTTDLPGGHREYMVKTVLRNLATGQAVGQGLGSCSTMESKYRWRNAARKCPQCGKEAIIKGKEEYGGGWICFKKKDGCGATFDDADPAIIAQEVGKIENTDIADVYNTALKIATKRSYVHSTISATAASDIFSQDAEDFVAEEIKPAPDQGTAKPAPKPAPRPEPKIAPKHEGPVSFKSFIDTVNSLPGKDRAGWMQKAKGGKDAALLESLMAEIRETYKDAPGSTQTGPDEELPVQAPERAMAKQEASQEVTPEKARIGVMEFINNLVPEADRAWLREELGKIPDDISALNTYYLEVQARYGDAGLFAD